MKKTILSMMTFLVMILSNFGISQCQYSFSSFNQTVSVNGDPLMTSVNTLSTCSEYVFDYSIGFSSTSITLVTDDITIELPFNVSFQSLVSSNGTVTVNSGTGNTVSLHVSGWTISTTPLQIELIGISSSCSATTVTGSSLAQLDGTLACGNIPSSNSVAIVSPQLYVDDVSLHNQNNIGDVDEIVFKIQNTSGNGALIQNVLVDYVLNSAIESYNNTYYISGSATVGSGNNMYTYTLPGSIFTATIPASTIPIDPADFQNVLGHGYLADNEIIYLHIPYFVNSCTGSTGSTGNFTFKRDCGNSVICDSQLQQHNISVISGGPYIGMGNVIPLHDENATFCATAGGQDMDLGWRLYGSNANPTGGPSGYGRVTDLQLLILVDNSFGSANPSTFTISNGSNSLNVGAYAELVDPAFVMLGGATTATLYKIHLENLPVSGSNWQPLGSNSLSDLDGDGFVDDLIEFGSLDIHVDYTYGTTTCPLHTDHGAYYTFATMQWAYKDACYTPNTNSAVGGNITWYQDGVGFGYTATGAGGELSLPSDILSNEPFVSELCFAPYTEEYSMSGLSFDCPNGFHRVIYEVPNGYHLDLSGLTASISQPGWYELPDMTVTSVSGGGPTQQVSPIVQEYCNPSGSGRIIEVRFGMIPYDLLFFARPFTMQLPCLELPMYLDCSGSDPSCPGLPNNFGFDNLDFRLEFVCDESCSTCSAYIVGGHASTYHHCPGLCESYFGTDPHPLFERTSLGYVNTTTGYIPGSDLTLPSDLTTSTQPTISLESAYPGDQISVQVDGGFFGTPVPTYTPHTGASYNDMYLQIRYDDLLPGERKEARLFDLEQLTGDGITITKTPLSGPSTQYTMPVSDLVMTDFVSLGVVHLNINFSSLGRAFINDATASYTFSSDLHLRVRAEPVSSGFHYFFSSGKHVLTSLRFEYKGTQTDDETIDGSCDDYGANFRILQPSARGPEGIYIGEPTYCGLTEVSFRFYNDAALFQIANDFPNEYRPYGQLKPDIYVTIPGGYTFVSASFVQDGKQFNSSLPNNFAPNYIPGYITLPATPVGPPLPDAFGNSIVHFTGLNNSTWPSLDLDVSNGGQYLFLKLLPNCEVPAHSDIYVAGEYTLGVNQNLSAYQYDYSFTTQIPLSHYAPNINIINPVATVNAYDGTAEFNFSVCNENLLMTGPANDAWFAFENSAVNGLDLTTATLINTQTNMPVSFTTYTDGGGHQGIIVNYGVINPQACVTFKLITHVSANGCVTGNAAVADYLTVYGGNSCDGTILTSPVEACTKEITQFAFNRYPSDLQLILPTNAYPTTPVEMCNGVLEYNFILNSYEVGAVSDVQFWLDLPNGLSLDNITFSTTGTSPHTYTTSTYDATTYGSGGNLSGWTILPHFPLTYLPGSLNSPGNQIFVHLEVQSSCDYDLSSPVLCYANSMNSCGQQTSLLEMSSLPLISNATLANDLVIIPTITFSDENDTLSCDNVATVTLTITNNSDVSNLTDLELTAQVPGSPLVVNSTTGTHTGNEVVWNIATGSIPANSTISVSYTITNPGVICQNDVPMSASIHFSQDVACTSTGGSCDVSLTTDTVRFDIDVCCNCTLGLTLSSEPVRCKGAAGSATANVSGAAGSVTYLWSDGQTTATATNLVAGTYSVTVTDENGCTETDSVVVESVNNPPVVTAVPDQDTICEGQSVVLTLGGGVNYSMWDGSGNVFSTGAPFTVTPGETNTYTINAHDQYGCPGSTTVTITVIPLPIIGVNNPTICAGASAILTASGATTYSWTPSGTLSSGTGSPVTASPTATTTYTVTGTTGGCSNTATSTVTVTSPPTITVNSATICAGGSATLTASGASSYTWTPSGTLSSGSGVTVTATPTTTTTYTVYGTNEFGCSGSNTSVVTVTPLTTPQFHIATSYCSGTTISSLPTTSVNGITGTWSPSAISNTTSGTYVFTPTAGQCASTYTLNVTINPNPTVTVNSATICVGGSAILTASGASSYSWTPTGTLSSGSGAIVTATPTTTTTYTVTGTNEFGCSGSANSTVTVNPATTPTFKMQYDYCVGSTPPAGSLPNPSLNGITGTWSPSTINTSTVGSYTYTFTPTAGQCASVVSVTINIVGLTTPTFTLGNTYCAGATVPTLPTPSTNGINGTWSPSAISNTTSGSYVFTPTAGQCASTYTLNVTINPNPVPVITYQDGGLATCAGGTVWLYSSSSTNNTWSTGATTSSINVPAGTYTVTVNNGSGCSATSAPVTVTVNPTPTISGTFSACIGGGTVTLTGSPSGGTWSSSNTSYATISSGGVVTPSSSNSGTTTITYTIGGCSGQQAFTVNPKPTITGTLSVCVGSTTQLTGNGTPAGTSPWTSSVSGVATVNSTGLVTGLSSGTTTITYTNSNGCQNTVTVTVNPKPTITGTLSVCMGATTQLTGNGTPAGTSPWTSSSTDVATVSSTGLVTGVVSGTTTITYTNSNGCQNTVTITVNPKPTITGILGVCVGSTTQLTGNGTPAGTSPWTSSVTGVATVNSTGLVTGLSSGTTTITYTNSNGCQNTVTVTVNPKPTITGTLSVCVGSTTQLTGNGTAATVSPWVSASTGVATVNSTGLVTGVSAGTSVITYTNSNGCQISATVTVSTTPTISTPSTSACVGGSAVQFTGSPTGGTWTTTASSIASVSATGLVTPSASNSGGVIITYTLGSCQKTQSFTVNPKPTITGTLTVCVGSTTTLTGNGTAATSSPWVSASTGVATVNSAGLVTGVSAGTSVITYTNSNGCQISVTVTVNPKPATPTITVVDGPTTFCYGSYADLLSSAASGNTWSPGGATTQEIFASTSGNYSVTVSNSYGCTATSSAVTITVNTATMAQPSNITVCKGLSVTVPAFSGATSYNWTRTAASIGLTPTSGTGNIPTFTSANPGSSALTSTFTVTPITTGGCGGPTKQFTITVNPCQGAMVTSNPSEGLLYNFDTQTEGQDEVETGAPILSVNPNPTSGQTSVLLDGAEGKTVEIKLFNMLGEEVTTLFTKTCCNETMIRLVWNSEEVPPGVYLIKAQVDAKTIVEKVVVSSH